MRLSRQPIQAAYEAACRREVEALKPGNVHVFADGHRMSADQFLASARVSSGPLTDPGLPVGRRILEAIRATRREVGTNTNLGIVLLSAPLAMAAGMSGADLRANLGHVLDGLTVDDAAAAFEAIVLAAPGGLGWAAAHDVREPARAGLQEAMQQAASRDLVARQYVTCFSDVFETGLPALETALGNGESGMWPAIHAYMAFLAGFPDSHVARKHGPEAASKIRDEAAAVRSLIAAAGDETARLRLLFEFDRSLKSRLVNPGTSADLTVACLFAHLLGDRLA
jgi:triphosphoribosyl-dephospho-CoA synthase